MTPEERAAALTLARLAGDDKDGLRDVLEAVGLIAPKPKRVVRISDPGTPIRMKRTDVPDNCKGCGIEIRKRYRKTGNPAPGRNPEWRYHGAHGMCTACYAVYQDKRNHALRQGLST